MKLTQTTKQVIFLLAICVCLSGIISPPIALLLGLIVSQTIGHPFISLNQKATGTLLKVSVIGLGFGMNLHHAIAAGKEGLVFTILSIVITLLAGWLLGKWLKVESKTSYLISSGTAICGGSAIAAVSSIIKANEKQMSVALGTIFILNSIALLIFPPIGHWLHLTQHEFGLWCAVAIHDTSSVVGASAKYGQEALQVATTVKLERALWIIPLSILTVFTMKTESKKVKIPYFIALFIGAMCIATYFPQFKSVYEIAVLIAKKGMTLTLFLIGAGLSLSTIKAVGAKPLIQGVILWIMISLLSLGMIFMSQ